MGHLEATYLAKEEMILENERSMKMLSVAAVGSVLYPGKKHTNLSEVKMILGSAPGRAADILVFPELNITGGFWKGGDKDYADLAERVPGGPACQEACDLAASCAKYLCCGLVERDGDSVFCTHILCGPDGFLGRQRKLFPHPPGKARTFTAGEQLHVFQCHGQRCAILACADALVPEPTILAGLNRVSLVLCPFDCLCTSQQPVVQRIIAARAMDLRANIVVSFGHNGEQNNDEVLAGMVCGVDGDLVASRITGHGRSVMITAHCRGGAQSPKWGDAKCRGRVMLLQMRELLGS